tara:strand:+ start:613 stop:936 length:324 start_codon:yes stop_codon:yes gene_type:complete
MSQINYVGLESVGSIVTVDGIVFPIDLSEGPETASDAEEMMGVHLVDTDNDWWNNMSVEDCNELMGFLTPLVLNGDLEWDGSFVNWGMERLQYVINHNYLIENMETI